MMKQCGSYFLIKAVQDFKPPSKHRPDTDVVTETKIQVKQPKLYTVIMYNDNYTTMDFVVYVLVEIFQHNIDKAYQLMMQIHESGQAAVALLPYDLAEMKVDEVTALAEQESYPLLTTIEPA